MKLLIILAIALVGCKPQEDASAVRTKPGGEMGKVFVIGDSMATRVAQILDVPPGQAITRDGQMIRGLQSVAQFTGDPLQPDDKIVYVAGTYDALYYGDIFAPEEARARLRAFLGEITASGAKVYIATVPRLPDYNFAPPLQFGSDQAMDFYSQMIRDVATEFPQVFVVDANAWLDPSVVNWDSGSLTETGAQTLVDGFVEQMNE